MDLESRQMSLAAYVRWTHKVAQAAYAEHYLPLGTEIGMPSTGNINNFKQKDHGHHGGMPDAAYLKMVRDAEHAWTNRME